MVAIGLMAPVLPKLIISFEQDDMTRAASVAGVIGLTWAGMQFVFSPIVGALSDRYGRRPVILLSNLGLGLDYVIMAIAPSVPWLFVGRALSGIFGASFATATAYVADVTPEEKRAGRIGLLGAAFGIGFVLGPAIGGTLGELDLRLPFWLAAALSLANAAYGYFVLPESLAVEHRAKLEGQIVNPFGPLKLLRSNADILGLAVAAFLCFLAHESLHATFVLYTDYRYAWSAHQVGLALSLVGIGSAIVAGLLVRPAVARCGERPVMLAGLILGAIGFTAYAIAPTGTVFLAATPLLSLWGLAGPAAGRAEQPARHGGARRPAVVYPDLRGRDWRWSRNIRRAVHGGCHSADRRHRRGDGGAQARPPSFLPARVPTEAELSAYSGESLPGLDPGWAPDSPIRRLRICAKQRIQSILRFRRNGTLLLAA